MVKGLLSHIRCAQYPERLFAVRRCRRHEGVYMAMSESVLGQKWAERIAGVFGCTPSQEVVELWTGMAKDMIDEVKAGEVTTEVTGSSVSGGAVTGTGKGKVS
jgi:hypothetical protein